MLTVAVALTVLLCLHQSFTSAQQEDFDEKASAIMQQAKSQVVILTNQLLTNATVITHAAEGNASRLLANLYNEINKGIADAQGKATQIGNSFQANLTKRAEEVMTQAAAIYTSVEASLRKSTNHVEETISRLLATSQAEMSRAVKETRTKLAAAGSAEANHNSTQPHSLAVDNSTVAP
ncbi:uncharacterized protein LOC124372820 [Homalodisca vitripennis]|uniref:uncharacterized protein LOC124372820 n=1 Tax=Homalodisca vitripennis TaxID=197043 RepID=UPI001EEB4EFF|nr:uncharacterized protein LOC124372820 [Homalodisca vitripennis]